MPAAIIAQVLRADTVDRTAAAVIAANPGTFLNGVSAVPAYLYQSLKTLWLPSGTISDFQNLVVPDLGTGQSSSAGSIVVIADGLTESVYERKSLRSDQPGAEVCSIRTLLYKPRASSLSISPIQNAGMRIRYLLDNTLRGSRGVSGNLPQYYVSLDITVDPRFPFFCFFERNTEPVLASEATLKFRADYVRMFSR